MHRPLVRRCLLVAASLAGLALTTAPAIASSTAGTAVMNGVVRGNPGLMIDGHMVGELTFVTPPSAAPLAIDDTCSLLGSGGTISGTCTGTASIQIGGTYTQTGPELVVTGAALINSNDSVTVSMACTLNSPYAACAVQFQG